MDSYRGYKAELFINNGITSLSSNQFAFSISDNIYSSFPTLNLSFSDESGAYTEFDPFMQGVPLSINYGLAGLDDLLSINFVSTSRDAVSSASGTGGLNNMLLISGIHAAFFNNRLASNKVLKNMSVADAVKELLDFERNLICDITIGKIEAYANDEPYRFIREVLLPQATNGKARPFYFFRNLWDEVYFQSLSTLEMSGPTENLFFIEDNPDDHIYNSINTFLPFNEKLEDTFINFSIDGKYLNANLDFEKINKTVATDAENLIPVLNNSRIYHTDYFHRQFNPNVDYDVLNTAFLANSLRSGIFVDKALVKLIYHPRLVSGKTVNITVGISNMGVSESFSGKWLIEQSTHTWEGKSATGSTQLILCRSSKIPMLDSLLNDLSYRD